MGGQWVGRTCRGENVGVGVDGLAAEVRDAALSAGLAAVGTCRAASWTRTRALLDEGRHGGRHGGMAFTYRNPPRSTEPHRILSNAATLVVGAWPYAARPPDPPSGPGAVAARVARYATEDHYAHLRAALDQVAALLRERGHRGVVMADDNSVVDREAAWRAGLGFCGKNANILLPGRGSWFILGSVVTDAVLPPFQPPVADQCGSCRRCIDGCPTGAIVGPGVIDARRCLAWLLQRPGTFPPEFRSALGDRIYGCDDCQEVCPAARREESRSQLGPPGHWLDAIELLSLDDADLLERCERWYIAGRDPNVVRRNLLLVTGNAGDPLDPEVLAIVEEFASHDDPLLAEHARWARGQLEQRRRNSEDGAA